MSVKHSAELGPGAVTAREPLAEGRAQVPVSIWGRGFCIFSTLSISWSTTLSQCPDENTKLRARLSSLLICLEVFEVTFALWRERWRPGGCMISPGCWREAVLELGAGPEHLNSRFSPHISEFAATWEPGHRAIGTLGCLCP